MVDADDAYTPVVLVDRHDCYFVELVERKAQRKNPQENHIFGAKLLTHTVS